MSASDGAVAHGGQQHPLADGHRHVVLSRLEAERAGHAAAAGVGRRHLSRPSSSATTPRRSSSSSPCDGSGRGAARCARAAAARSPARAARGTRSEKRLLRSLSARASSGNRLRSSSRNTDAQLGSSTTIGTPASICGAEMVHHRLQIRLRAIEHAEIVERASAAEPLARNGHAHTGRLQHLERRAARLRVEIVVEGVGPEHDLAPCRRPSCCPGARHVRASAPISRSSSGASLGISRCGARCSTRFTRPSRRERSSRNSQAAGVTDPSAAHLSMSPNA